MGQHCFLPLKQHSKLSSWLHYLKAHLQLSAFLLFGSCIPGHGLGPLCTLFSVLPLPPTCQGSSCPASCFLLAYESLQFCPPASECVQHTDIKRPPMAKTVPRLSLPPLHSFSLCTSVYQPMSFLSNMLLKL